MSSVDTPSIDWRDIKSEWGETAWQLIKKIKTPRSHPDNIVLKKITLLLIASYRLQGKPIGNVFKREDSASSTSHYKWMNREIGDPDYRAACKHLLKFATKAYRENQDEVLEECVIQIDRAVTEIKVNTTRAVYALTEGLGAEQVIIAFNPDSKLMEIVDKVPDHTNRIRAANSILDRVADITKNKKQEISTPDLVKYIKEEDADLV